MSNEDKELFQLFTREFDKIHSRFNEVDARMDKLDSRMDKLDSRMDKLEHRLDILEVKQDRTSAKLDELQFQFNIFEHTIRNDIHLLKDSTETIEQILRFNNMLPLKQSTSV